MRLKELIILALGLLIGWIISTWINSPGKYQITDVLNPRDHIKESCLLDTRTGRIQRIYNFDNYLMFGKPEATMKQWENWQEAMSKNKTTFGN
jgi:hypothetical protein